MNSFFTIVKSDYLQRTRSYAFLITLCASVAIAYTFVPEPNASYSTIRIADHVGTYNSAWFGYVTAIMTSIFLSLFGYYLVNSGIKKDIGTKVGHIIASTPISNVQYLLAKGLSNFLLLLSIVGIVFGMSIILFFLYNDGSSFELIQFITPYLFITIPAMFFTAVTAVVFEVIFKKYMILQQLAFFVLFSVLMAFSPKSNLEFSLDVFGSKIVMYELEQTVRTIIQSDDSVDLSIGYVLGNTKKPSTFEFNGLDFPASFVISRVLILFIGIGLIAGFGPLFHRFNLLERVSNKKPKNTSVIHEENGKTIVLASIPIATTHYGIGKLLKIEFVMLLRKGKKWLWLLNITGMILLVVLPLDIAHQVILPILWFLQVHRISDISTKELTHNVHYFAFASYQPMRRVFFSQLSAAIVLLICLASPLVFRLVTIGNLSATSAVLLGATGIVLVASLFGMLTKGKKLFEVFFFMLTYANINGIPRLDYFGGFEHDSLYTYTLVITILLLGAIGFFSRKHQLHD